MSEIPNGLRADIMRKRMLDKNTLSSAGSLYMGTGELEVGTEQDDDRNKVYKVTRLPKGENNQILICKFQNNTSSLPYWSSYENIQKWTITQFTNNDDFNTLTGFSRDYNNTEYGQKIQGQKIQIDTLLLLRQGYNSIFIWIEYSISTSVSTFVPGLISIHDLRSDSKKECLFIRSTNVDYNCALSWKWNSGTKTSEINIVMKRDGTEIILTNVYVLYI